MSTADTGTPVAYRGFLNLLGFNWDVRSAETFEGHLDVTPDHMNRAGMVHGGIYATMLDAACSGVGMYCPHPGRIRVSVTLSLTVNYAGQCRGGRISVKSWITKQGRSVYYSAGEVRDDKGELLANAVGTFKYIMHSGGPEGIPAP